ncbi:MAG: response regulator [Chloroflexota bacterium]
MTYILVAEDDPHIQLLIQRKLEIAGYKVRTTNNGKSALELALTDTPRIVLLDIMLPEMNGLDVCHAIKKQLGVKAPPIMMISARGSQIDVNAAEQLGADDYLIKPFSLGDLLEHVQSLLRG